MRDRQNGNTESVDNYLKAILSLGGGDDRRVSSKALADTLRVAPASVTNMLQKLAATAVPMVEYQRHRGVMLSAAGRRRALEVLRHHRLLETFLYEVLDYPIEEVHAEAERLEHFISERFEERIAAKLGHPVFDPHGHSIPALDGAMTARQSIRLADVSHEGKFVIESVSDHDPRALQWIQARGITPGVRLSVRRADAAGIYTVWVGDAIAALEISAEVAAQVRLMPLAAELEAETATSMEMV